MLNGRMVEKFFLKKSVFSKLAIITLGPFRSHGGQRVR